MEHRVRSSLAAGLVLVLLGVWFLIMQFVPGLQIYTALSWPLIIVGVGVILLVIGLFTGVPSMAVPASIVGGIGGLLYWQNATGNWESWAYTWTLIPGFVGVGTVLASLLGGESRQGVRGGVWLILISLLLFAAFGSFFGALGLVGSYWPLLLIALGILIFVRSLFQFR
jgi:hypothetical protein